MTTIERADQSAVQLARAYSLLNELCIVIRTSPDGVRLICPRADNDLMATLLRKAADILSTQGATRQ